MQIASALSLAQLRAVNARNLPHSAVVAVAVTTPQPGGRGVVTSWTPTATLPCRLAQASSADREQLTGTQLTTETAYVVAFEAGADVQRKHRLTVTGVTTTPAGDVPFTHVLHVVQVLPIDRAGEFLRRVLATEVKS
jgi:head-tail adaptor